MTATLEHTSQRRPAPKTGSLATETAGLFALERIGRDARGFIAELTTAA